MAADRLHFKKCVLGHRVDQAKSGHLSAMSPELMQRVKSAFGLTDSEMESNLICGKHRKQAYVHHNSPVKPTFHQASWDVLMAYLCAS